MTYCESLCEEPRGVGIDGTRRGLGCDAPVDREAAVVARESLSIVDDLPGEEVGIRIHQDSEEDAEAKGDTPSINGFIFFYLIALSLGQMARALEHQA